MAIFHKIVQALAVAVTMITVTAVAVAVTMITVTAVAVAVAMITVTAVAVAVTVITVTAVAVAVTMVTVTAVAVAVAMVTVGVAVAVVAGGVACSHHLLKLSLLLGRELRQVNATGIHGYEKDDRGDSYAVGCERLPRQNDQFC